MTNYLICSLLETAFHTMLYVTGRMDDFISLWSCCLCFFFLTPTPTIQLLFLFFVLFKHLVGGIVGAAVGYHLRQDTTTIEGEKPSTQSPTAAKTQAGTMANEFKHLLAFVGRDGGSTKQSKKKKN